MSRRRKPRLPAFEALLTEGKFGDAVANLTTASPADIAAFRLLCFDSSRMFNKLRNITEDQAELMLDQVQDARRQAAAKLVAITAAERRLLEVLQFVFAVKDGEAAPPDGVTALLTAAEKLKRAPAAAEVAS
jgi:hypothetical protein